MQMLIASEIFNPRIHEAKVLIEQWRGHYNAVRPRSSLGYRPPRRASRSRTPLWRRMEVRSQVAGLASY